MREFDLVAHLAERLRARRDDTRLAIGDDAAVIAPPSGTELAVTTDTLIGGRHLPADTPAFDVGYKALAVNLSDLAAMGARPAWATIALAMPDLESDWCNAFIDGALAAIGDAEVDLVGGDTTRGDLSITVTAIGLLAPGRALTRAGALVGDAIAVTGTLGDAAAGLACWAASDRADADDRDHDPDTDYLQSRLCRPQWRKGEALVEIAHAAIDISDGLSADLGHVLDASGVGACIDVDALPASPPFHRRVRSLEARRRLQLTGGDDYELCLALAADDLETAARALDCRLTRIGTIEAAPGLRMIDSHGTPVVLPDGVADGWDHFA